ncbi:MAG: hypothetical protein RBU30_25160, partial [Polyangia bacterium]|nr:hypothetical protein [Polyangia bacterium]
VAGNQEGFYPMNINGYTRRGIISAGTYYTFDPAFQSMSAFMSGEPLTLGAPLAGSMAAEIGSKILYGFWDSNFNDYSPTVSTSATSIPLHFFDTETLEDGTLMIDLSPHPLPFAPFENKNWRFVAAIGDYLFLEESSTETRYFFSVDLGDVLPAIWLAHQSTGVSLWAGTTMATSSFAVSFAPGTPFMAYLMKPDGTMAEVNADMLGFNPQTIEVEEDQIVVTGMDGLTPRRFIINPLATEDGELLVETATDTIPMKTLIPLQ